MDNNINTWNILNKELKYFGIKLTNNKNCQFYDASGRLYNLSIQQTIQRIKKGIKSNIELFALLWQQVEKLLLEKNTEKLCIDENLKKLFIFSLKELSKMLLCFSDLDNSNLSKCIDSSLNRDINSFNSYQIDTLSNLKISLDWVHRLIHRLRYIVNLLEFASTGEKEVSNYRIKTARGVSGPSANLDLPMQERMYSYKSEDGRSLKGRQRDKINQRRYKKGLENYNNSGSVGEGYYWREIRNEPFSWYNRSSESPYPSRNTIMNM